MTAPWLVAAIAGGGALGAVLRHAVLQRARSAQRGLLAVNLSGSLLAGLAMGLGAQWYAAQPWLLAPELRQLIVGAFCGGLTTFGTWAVLVVQQPGPRGARTIGRLALMVLGSCLAAALGALLGGGVHLLQALLRAS